MIPPPSVFMSAGVATIILNYLHANDTIRCVHSVQRSDHRHCSVTVIDNGSGADIVGQLRSGIDPAISIVETGENLGYAAGNNNGIELALRQGADFIWVLNPDTVVEPNTLSRMVGVMHRYPEAGVVGTRILNGAYDPPTISFNGGVIDWSAGGATSHRHLGRLHQDLPNGGIESVDYVTGASMLVRRAVFHDVGLIPEDYFLYFEEADFCTRARAAGWSNLIDSGALLWHHKRSATRTPSPYYVYYFCRGRILFRNRFVPGPTDVVPADLADFIQAWRKKVADRAPRWLETYDRLVSWAIEDGMAGMGSRRDDIADVPTAEDLTA